MASSTKNVKLGVCQVFFDGVDLGYTQGGVEVQVKTDTHKVNVDQFGKTTINEYIMGRDVMAKVPLAETTLENMVAIMPGATLTTVGGAVATGSITIATNPSSNDTIVVNGKTITFKTQATVDGEVTLGANAAGTAAALAAALNASNDPAVAAATYAASGAVVSVTFGSALVSGTAGMKGVEGNGFTLGAGTAGSKVTLSGATLSGGVEPSSKFVTVTNGVGTDLLQIARELRLHPVGKAADDKSEDFFIPLAATSGALQFAYKLENERIYNVEFNGYPDSANGGRLFAVGGY
jgi:hypothetical protein